MKLFFDFSRDFEVLIRFLSSCGQFLLFSIPFEFLYFPSKTVEKSKKKLAELLNYENVRKTVEELATKQFVDKAWKIS